MTKYSFGGTIVEVLDVEERETDDLVEVMLDDGSTRKIGVCYTPLDMLVGADVDDVI